MGPIWVDALLSAGANVAGLDIEGAPVSSKYKALREKFGEKRLGLYRADVTDKKELAVVLAECTEKRGVPSILVNNAGLDQPPGPATSHKLEDIPAEICRGILDVNLVGAFNVMQIFGAAMVVAGKGSIINIGSLYASVSPDARTYDHIPSTPPFLKPPFYGASKAALVNLSSYFATHWGPFGVRVNTLSPGGVLGEQDPEFKRKFCARVPLGRMAEPKDLTGPLIFLASEASSYITGVNINVDGGYTAW